MAGFLKRLGTLPLILFWLALEYIVYCFGYNFFLGNVLVKTDWTRWSQYTGVGGISLWILISAWFLYLTLFKKWQYAAGLVIVILAPILYSYSLTDMPPKSENEWVLRTAAWISVLILLSAVVKELIRKK